MMQLIKGLCGKLIRVAAVSKEQNRLLHGKKLSDYRYAKYRYISRIGRGLD